MNRIAKQSTKMSRQINGNDTFFIFLIVSIHLWAYIRDTGRRYFCVTSFRTCAPQVILSLWKITFIHLWRIRVGGKPQLCLEMSNFSLSFWFRWMRDAPTCKVYVNETRKTTKNLYSLFRLFAFAACVCAWTHKTHRKDGKMCVQI